MGKATQRAEYMADHPLTPEEIEERDGPRPRLRLTPNALAQALTPGAQVKDVLDQLKREPVDSVTVLHDAQSGVTAVAVPAEQYFELVTSYIRDWQLYEGKTDGRIGLPDATVSELRVEQVNPRDTWGRPIPGYDPSGQPSA